MSKQAPRTQKYLRACADFVDRLKDERIALSSLCIAHSDALEVDHDAIDAFLAKAQEQS